MARNREWFREKALERLASPERLDQLLQLTDRRSWLPLVTMLLVVSVLLGWAVFGSIPIHVEGRGILVRPRQVVEIQAPGSGYLAQVYLRPGEEVRAGDLLAELSRPDLVKQLDLQRAKVRELTALQQATRLLRLRDAGEHADASRSDPSGQGELARHLRSAGDLAGELRAKELDALAAEREMLEEQRRLAADLAESLRRSVEGRRELRDAGILSDDALVETETSHLEGVARVADLDARLHRLRARELEVEDRYLNRLQRVADLSLELSDYEQQLADAYREIERLQTVLANETRIVSEHDGRVLETSAQPGRFLRAGERIGALARHAPESPLISLTYFTVRDGKRVRPERPIHVAPDTVERERYGSLVGTVREVYPLPVTLAEAESAVGNRVVAESLTAGGRWIQVFSELEVDAESPTGFRWTSKGGSPDALSAGITTTARVVVEERAPITLVLPFLRSAAGLD